MKAIFALVLFSVYANHIKAQGTSLHGIIKDEKTASPLEKVNL